ncbi:MAG: Conserved TM helix repeat-containing protein [archaeon GW2011_AR20]|nr:MAG: Conserved TM helix repeat-containing protein [archaeon GW2011_AR20]MBS3160758.1 hypothetical protein [Candidatus Woesearchaeota archaeon]
MALDAISTTGSLILNPLISLWNGFVGVLPGIIAAIIVLIIGYFVALGVGHAVKVLLEKAGLDGYLERSKFAKGVGHFNLSRILGEVTKWYIFLIFIQSGVDLLRLGTLSSLLNEFVRWLPNVIVAAIIVIFGVALAHFVSMKIEEHTKTKGVRFFSKLIKIVIYYVVLVISLEQIGVEASILENTFLILIGALAVGIAVALGIGLGKAMQPEGKEIVNDLKDLMHH